MLESPFSHRVLTPVLAALLLASTPLFQSAAAQIRPAVIMLSVDTPSEPMRVQNGDRVFVGGWAVDPTGFGTGIDRIEVYLDGAPGAGGVHIGQATYGAARPDVAERYGRPDWTNSGFGLTWRCEELSAGDHKLYVYAVAARPVLTVATINVTVDAPPTRNCSFMRPCAVNKIEGGWELDYGGPGIYYDRTQDDRLME